MIYINDLGVCLLFGRREGNGLVDGGRVEVLVLYYLAPPPPSLIHLDVGDPLS